MRRGRILWLGCVALATATAGIAQEHRLVGELIDNIVREERDLVETLRGYQPILETYLQELAAPEDPYALPARDHYMIGRLDLSEGVDHIRFFESAGFTGPDQGRWPLFRHKNNREHHFIAEVSRAEQY